MNSLENQCEHIESVHFAVNFSVIGNTNIFKQALTESDLLNQFAENLRANPGYVDQLFERVVFVLRLTVFLPVLWDRKR